MNNKILFFSLKNLYNKILILLLLDDKHLMLLIRQSSARTYIIFIAMRTQITKYFRMGIVLKALPQWCRLRGSVRMGSMGSTKPINLEGRDLEPINFLNKSIEVRYFHSSH